MLVRHKTLVFSLMVLITLMGTLLFFSSQAHANEPDQPGITLDASGSAASLEEATFSLTEFSRNNKGTARAYEGQEFGYRYPQVGKDAFSAVLLKDKLLVFIPAAAQQKLDTDFLSDSTAQEQLISLLKALDEANANGGITLAQVNPEVEFIETETFETTDSIIRFDREVESGYYYTTIEAKAGADQDLAINKLATFVLSGYLVHSDDAVIQPPAQGVEAFGAFLSNMDYRPFWVSLRTSLTAVALVFILGIAAARLSLRMSPRLKDVLDAIFTIPLVLPPTVIGFLLLVTFGNSTALGRWLVDNGISLVFSWPAAVIAATVVAFPLMYRTVRGALEAQDPEMLDAARTLGWSERRIFFRLMLPLAWHSIAAGTVLAFARAMGEFGATLFVAGNYAGVTQTMPIAIYFQWMGGRSDVATFWVFVVILISFVVILFINLYARHTQKFRQTGTVKASPYETMETNNEAGFLKNQKEGTR